MPGAEVDKLWVWGQAEERPRLLHTMIRVRDIDAALRFYRDGLAMRLLDRYDFGAQRFSILFLSFSDYSDGPALELTYNWDVEEPYSHGSGFGHIALGTPDVAEAVGRLAEYGGTVFRPPYQLVPEGPTMAFVRDPDGYLIELIQTQRPS